MNFTENLNMMIGDSLRTLLKVLGEKKLPGCKGKMVDRLRDIWTSEPQRLVDMLSEPEKLMLAECVHEGCAFPSIERVNARFGFSYSLYGPGRYGHADFIYCFIYRPDRSGYEMIVDVTDKLKLCIPVPPPLTIKESIPPERQGAELERYESERNALTEVKRVLQLVATGKLTVSEQTRLPTAGSIKQVASCLCEPETPFSPERSYAWVVLVQQCGWAKPKTGKLHLSKTGKDLLNDFTPESYASGVKEMIYDNQFDEMSRVPGIKGMKGKWARQCIEDVDVRRESISCALENFPVGKWIKFNNAFDYIVASGNRFYVVEDGGCLYICDAHYGTLNGHELDIAKVYFRILAAESLATLGLMDTACCGESARGSPDLGHCWGLDGTGYLTRYDSVKYLRLTPLGAFCFSGAKEYEMPKVEQRPLFKVLPNLEIVVTDAAAFSAGDEATLDRFANKVSDSVWKMDKKTIFQGLENGDSAEDIRSILNARSATEIPQTVLNLIEETTVRSGSATQREEAIAVSFRDEPTAALVENDPAIRPTLFCRHGNTLFVRAQNLKKFQGGLRKLGILLP